MNAEKSNLPDYTKKPIDVKSKKFHVVYEPPGETTIYCVIPDGEKFVYGHVGIQHDLLLYIAGACERRELNDEVLDRICVEFLAKQTGALPLEVLCQHYNVS